MTASGLHRYKEEPSAEVLPDKSPQGGQTVPSLSRPSLGTECGEHLGPHIQPGPSAAEAETLSENFLLTGGCVWAQEPPAGEDPGHTGPVRYDMVGCHTEAVPPVKESLGSPEA